MNLEQLLRDDLHHTAMPATLAPPPDLAETVLADLRRQRRNRMLATGALAVAAAVAVAVPVIVSSETGTGVEPGGPFEDPVAVFPRPGGGPQAIHAYTTYDPARSFLLDVDAGEYRELPFPHVLVSPDLTAVAVTGSDGRVGVAERAALLAEGEAAVDWLDVPPGTGPAWSPDGSALLTTSLVKDEAAQTVRFTAHRFDLATGTVTDTAIAAEILGGTVGWAADSRRYLALLVGGRDTDTVEPGVLQYIEPDGTLGEVIEIEGGLVGGAESYSPSREYLIADTAEIMSEERGPSKIVDIEVGRVVAELPAGDPVGWYDESTVALHVPDEAAEFTLELVDITSGTVTETIDLSGLPTPGYVAHPGVIQLGSSEGLTGPAADYGF